MQILKRGSVNKNVVKWQSFLGLIPDGIFGEATEKEGAAKKVRVNPAQTSRRNFIQIFG